MSRGRRERSSAGPSRNTVGRICGRMRWGCWCDVLPDCCALGLGATSALAADFDCQRVTLIVPYPAGGATDVAARLVGDRLELGMKRSFVIENRPGATGNIGTAAVANAKPDGCTLLVNAAVIATFPWSFSKLGFDPVKDLAPIGGIGVTPTLLVAPKSLPADDLKGLVLLSKQRPDGLSFSTAGYGLLQHLAVEEMAQRTGAKFVHVVYKGGAQAATDLIAGRVDFGSFAAGSVIQFVKEGQLKPLGVIQETRSDLVPDVATTPSRACPASMPAFISCCMRRRQRPGRSFRSSTAN